MVSSARKASILIQILYKYMAPCQCKSDCCICRCSQDYAATLWFCIAVNYKAHVQCGTLVTVASDYSFRKGVKVLCLSKSPKIPLHTICPYTRGVFSLSVFQQIMFSLPPKSISLKLCSMTEDSWVSLQ